MIIQRYNEFKVRCKKMLVLLNVLHDSYLSKPKDEILLTEEK